MKSAIRTVTLLAVVVLMAAIPAQAQAPTEIPIGQPTTLAIGKDSFLQLRAVTGDIEVTRAVGPEVVVTAIREGGAAEPRVVLIEDGKGFTLCTVYSSPNPKKPNECLPKGKGRLNEGITKDSPKMRVHVAMPEGVLFIARINLGNIQAAVGASDLDLKTDFGNISIVDGGSASIWASIVTKGDLTARISPVDYKYQRDIRLTCQYGAMRVYVDESLPIEYQISAYGSIETPFRLARPKSLTRTGRLGPDAPTSLRLNLDAAALFARLYLLPILNR